MRIATVFLFLLCLGSASGHVRAQPAPAILTDSPATCTSLSRRLPPSSSEAVRRLQRRGQAMCDRGEVRGGIMELRRALMLSRGGGRMGA